MRRAAASVARMTLTIGPRHLMAFAPQILLLSATAMAASGCEIAYVLAKRKEARGEGGPYRQSIQSLLYHDKEYPVAEYGEETQCVGRIPASFDEESSVEGLRLRARHEERGTTNLIFAGIDDGQICFVHPVVQEVINFSDEELARVERIASSYELVAEFAGPLTSPAVTERGLKPGPGAAALKKAVTVGAETHTSTSSGSSYGKKYMVLTQRRCAPAPRKPKKAPVEWLTVLVTPKKSVELDDDPYLLAWQVLPEK